MFTSIFKTKNQIIDEIHESFYTEVDRLLESAKIAHSLDTDKQALIDKRDRLRALGFTSTKEGVEAGKEVRRLSDLKAENSKKKELIVVINYFSFKYPNYKFITEDSVKKICQKYGLIYSKVGRYKGDVPENNLKHIEKFKIKEIDECYHHACQDLKSVDLFVEEYIDFLQAKKLMDEKKDPDYYPGSLGICLAEIANKCPLEIAAPKDDFDMSGMEIKDFKLSKIQVPNPIVLKPVIFHNQKYYLIVTAWGQEAGDELVINQRFN